VHKVAGFRHHEDVQVVVGDDRTEHFFSFE
jgi:hypothetical protein